MKPVANNELTRILLACRAGFLAVVFFSFFINMLMLTAPLYMMQVFDRVLASRSEDTLFFLLLIASIALIVFGLLDGVRGVLLTKIGRWLDEQAGPTILSKSIMGALANAKDRNIQGLRDLTTVRTFMSGPSIFPILDAPWAPFFLVVMFMLHPLIGWMALLGAVVLFSLALLNEFATRQLVASSNGATMSASRRAEASVRNADVINAMGMLPSLLARWKTDNAAALSNQEIASRRSIIITSISRSTRFLLQIAVLTIGAWLVINAEMSPGSMIASSILMGRALAPVEQAIGSWKSVISAREAYGRLKVHLASDAPATSMPLPAPTGELEAADVTYMYAGVQEPTLKKVTFKLEAGEIMGLIGPTASGKTTLARLIVGNLAPRQGNIRLDGMDVSQWDSNDLGPHVGYMPQDVELFNGTVGENIARMGEPDPDQVVAAANLAGVHKMILSMSKGYDTEIGDDGTALSGGQRQRIGLARAVYGNPRLVVLDEPNANLDNEGETALTAAVDTLKASGATVILVSHRPNLLRNVDKILVLENGVVKGFGTPDQIVPKAAPIPEPMDAVSFEAAADDRKSVRR